MHLRIILRPGGSNISMQRHIMTTPKIIPIILTECQNNAKAHIHGFNRKIIHKYLKPAAP